MRLAVSLKRAAPVLAAVWLLTTLAAPSSPIETASEASTDAIAPLAGPPPLEIEAPRVALRGIAAGLRVTSTTPELGDEAVEIVRVDDGSVVGAGRLSEGTAEVEVMSPVTGVGRMFSWWDQAWKTTSTRGRNSPRTSMA